MQLEQLIELFDREQITMEILAEMGHEDLKQVGVSAYGFRHKILKGIAAIRATTGNEFLNLRLCMHALKHFDLLQVWASPLIRAHF